MSPSFNGWLVNTCPAQGREDAMVMLDQLTFSHNLFFFHFLDLLLALAKFRNLKK